MPTPYLEIRDLHAWYGESHVLHGVTFDVREGEVVTLLGRNGAGRTSTMRAIMGLVGSRKGSIKVHGKETIDASTHSIARMGIGYCPEERGIFASLTNSATSFSWTCLSMKLRTGSLAFVNALFQSICCAI